MKKILIVSSTSGQVVTFREKIIEKFLSEGYEVGVLTFDDEYKKDIIEKGIKFYCVNDKNRSINPIKILSLKNRYKKIIENYKPDIVFTFMLKPNIFGVLAAKSAGIKNIYSMVEGAGDVFINNTLKWKIIRIIVCYLYKKAFKNSNKVFFLNNDDKNEFVIRHLVTEEQCEVVHGIGVDIEHFIYKPIKNHTTFIMIARMLKTKGVIEYCKAAKIVKQKYPDAEFNYIGSEGNIKLTDIKSFLDSRVLNYLGTTNDVRPYLEECAVYVLPSYREGMSVSIMEAQANGRAVITTNTNGCRDQVVDGNNGFLVDVKNVEQLAEKMIWFIEHPDRVDVMGKNARKFAENNFNQQVINQKLFDIVSGEV